MAINQVPYTMFYDAKPQIMPEVFRKHIDTYQKNLHELYTLKISAFQWHNLPEGLYADKLEEYLTHYGSVAVFVPEGASLRPDEIIWLATPYREPESVLSRNVYNMPQKYFGIDQRTGQDIPIYTSKSGKQLSYIIKDNTSYNFNGNCLTTLRQLQYYAQLLTEIDITIELNIIQQRSPYIAIIEPNERLSAEEFYYKIRTGEPFIKLAKSKNRVDDKPPIDVLETNAEMKANSLMELRDKIWNRALTMLGIASEPTKKERMLTDEISAIRQEDRLFLSSGILPRIEFCNKFNKAFGYNISVNLSDVYEDYKITGETKQTYEGEGGNDDV